MGQARGTHVYPDSQYTQFRHRVHREIDWMLSNVAAAPAATFGNETELVLVDSDGRPLRLAPYVMRQGRRRGHSLVDELLSHQGEANGLVLPFSPRLFDDYTRITGAVLDDVADIAAGVGGQLGLFGVIPSLSERDLLPSAMTPGNPRFKALGRHLGRLGPIRLRLGGLDLVSDNFCLAGVGNSEQTHRSVGCSELVDVVNAAQMAASLVVAATAGSPVVLGKRVGAEGRIPLFTGAFRQQPTLGPCRRLPGGPTWVETPRQVLEYCLGFQLIMPELSDAPVSDAWHWRFFNGLTHPWVCPTYYPASGTFGIETRAKPAGPTVIDQAINHALDLALTATLTKKIGTWIADGFPYHCVVANFEAAAAYGLEALLFWPDRDGRPTRALARDVILDALDKDAVLALADLGLGMPAAHRILALAKSRIRSGRTAAHWISYAVDLDACDSWEHRLASVTLLYLDRSATKRPVHTWQPASIRELTTRLYRHLSVCTPAVIQPLFRLRLMVWSQATGMGLIRPHPSGYRLTVPCTYKCMFNSSP